MINDGIANRSFAALFACFIAPAGVVSAEAEFKIKGNLARGKAIYEMHCASCHGVTGSGEGVCASTLSVKPRALTDSNYMATLSDQHMFTVIKEGGAAVGKSSTMTAWMDVLKSDQAIHDVAAYVRSLSK